MEGPMNIIILENAVMVEEYAAALVLHEVHHRPYTKLGLATGRTMEGVYKHLVRAYGKGFDFSEVTTFNLDEYVGLSPIDEASYRTYMDNHFFDKTNIDRERTHLPHGLPRSVSDEVERYKQLLDEASPLDMQLLGIGGNGHIGFNEPPSLFGSDTRLVTLSDATRQQNAGAFNDIIDDVPTHAITMGVQTILRANKLVLVATGASKASAVAGAIEGPVQASLPASAIQLHHSVWVVLDVAAANKLKLQSYYQSQAANNSEVQNINEYINRHMR